MQFNYARILAMGLVTMGGLLAADSASADPPTRETLNALSAEEKTSLFQKKVRFDALPPAEQARLRELSTAIANSQHSDQLRTTLDRYHEWLKTLTTKQRADLLELSADERIERIKQLMQEQERARLRELGGQKLPEADIDAIFNWLDTFIQEHEHQFLKRLPEDYRRKLQEQEEVSRRRSLMRGLLRFPRNDAPLPTSEYLDELRSKLTPATRSALESAKTPEEKQQLARQWMFAAMYSKVFPPASAEDLRKIYDELSPDQRERLDRKSPEDMKRELTWRYHSKQWPGREGGWRGPGGPGFGPGFGSGGFRPGGPGNGSGQGLGGPDRKGPDRRTSEREDPEPRNPSAPRPPAPRQPE
jgi:hypothetical protein